MHVGSVGGINAAGFDIENAQPSIWTSTKKDYFGIGKTLRQQVHESDSRLLSHQARRPLLAALQLHGVQAAMFDPARDAGRKVVIGRSRLFDRVGWSELVDRLNHSLFSLQQRQFHELRGRDRTSDQIILLAIADWKIELGGRGINRQAADKANRNDWGPSSNGKIHQDAADGLKRRAATQTPYAGDVNERRAPTLNHGLPQLLSDGEHCAGVFLVEIDDRLVVRFFS